MIPGTSIHQTDFSGTSNVFSPIFFLRKNIGNQDRDNQWDDDDYYYY